MTLRQRANHPAHDCFGLINAFVRLLAMANLHWSTQQQACFCAYMSAHTHYSVVYHDWSLQTLQAALVIKIVHYNNSAYMQVSFKANFSCQWWRACRRKESSERRMSQNKRQNGVEGSIITSTILSLLCTSHFFSLPIVLAQTDSHATLGPALNQRGDY